MDPESELIRDTAEKMHPHMVTIAEQGREFLANPAGRASLSAGDAAKMEFLIAVADVAASGDDAIATAVLIHAAESGEMATRTAEIAARSTDVPNALRHACRDLLRRRGLSR